ncbi:hypothetical protein COCC4DRAFT_37672 [Bipolaris maydis ATCC 48331]|uniref:Uncharacterized protein n=2 Tax=Cochliobolus heterostrophus TaxID=5016 RepID=N4XRV0_COCH4|nr:uncharacterized protein COCC4DRAFT_37672 [Bipolaris maydis ATCC 48331]ENI07892.1 hypothetical protein COCC4DRAFT_37672 [Bipolaris maydis ATCC 48331]KAJ6281464.1 hypothetical protein J3E71DRAFT_342175 [Bipolaris maydis]
MAMSRHNHHVCRHTNHVCRHGHHRCRSIPFGPMHRNPVPVPAHPATEWDYAPQDFEDVVIKWGPYTTDDLVKASPHYTKITVDVDPYAKLQFPERWESTERVIHAVHPIPRADLEDLGPNCMRQLGERLKSGRGARDAEFEAAVQRTLKRIDDALEFYFCVERPGARVVSEQ